jgi:hypothetical protein
MKKLTALHSFFVLYLACAVLAANYPLEIIQPREGLDTKNRYYKAYPGLVYDVKIAAIGGSYPYHFELLEGPEGMTLKGDSITWVPPLAAEGSNVTVKAVDTEGMTDQVSWQVKVTKDRWFFVDSVQGRSIYEGATGTIDDPFSDVIDVYGGDTYDDKYARNRVHTDYFVYFREGKYKMGGFRNPGAYGIQYTYRQPLVWIAYPGEHVVLDLSENYWFGDSTTDNLYIEGLEVTPIDNPTGTENRFGFRVVGSSDDVVFRRNHFHNMTHSTGSHNQAFIMATGVQDVRGRYWVIAENEFENVNHGYGSIIGYSTEKVLIENNIIHDIKEESHAIGPKAGTALWTIRNNTIFDIEDDGIWLYYADYGSLDYGDMEVCYNYVHAPDANQALVVNEEANDAGRPSHIYRNTFVGNVDLYYLSTALGPFYIHDNVIINDRIDKIACIRCSHDSTVRQNNLFGNMSDMILDGEGRLTGAFSHYRGIAGWEQGNMCAHSADNSPCDGIVSTKELTEHIKSWQKAASSLSDLMSAIRLWKTGG